MEARDEPASDEANAESPSDGPNHDLAHGGYVGVRAIDLAGNTVEAAYVYTVDSCSHPPYCDGGWGGGSPDASPPDASTAYCDGGPFGEDVHVDNVGCSIGAGSASSGGSIVVGLGLFALALVVIARRRRRDDE